MHELRISLRIITVLTVLFFDTLPEVLCNNFQGGIIMVRPTAGGEPKEIEISYYVSWEQDDNDFECNSSAVENGHLLDGTDSIDCLYGCSGVITRMSYICTCYSADDNWSFGKNQLTYEFNDTTDINTVTIGSLGKLWHSEINGTWNISTTFSLSNRSDTGEINSSPRAVTTPLLHLQEGCKHTIPLDVSDPDNDTIQCRWAVGEECKDICNQFPGAFLDSSSCTIKYHANYGTGMKAVAIMIEDYAPGSSRPLSSVAFQFLVSVFSSSQPCSENVDYFKPTISINSSSNLIIKSYRESMNVSLTCMANGASSYYWEKYNNSLPYDSIGTNTSMLILNDIQLEDSGNYRCVVTDNCGVTKSSDYFTVTIMEGNRPHFIKHPMSQFVSLKSNFTNISLTCEAEGASTYRWERQYDSIPSGAIGVNTNTLTLINLQLKDAGQYRCVAINASGSTESNYAALFLKASSSTFVTHPTDTSAAAPFSAVFTCSAYGYGHQHIRWHKEHGKLPHRHTIEHTSSSTIVISTLIIANVTEQDVGKYYCQVWANNIGSQSERANLYYSGIPPKPVVIMQPSQLINITVNNFVLSMTCTSYTNGFEYKWKKKNERNLPRAQDINSRQLIIRNLKPEDSGEYRCVISNSTGVIMSEFSYLTVEVALPVITKQPKSIVVQTFSIGSFECTARSYGNVSIVWKRLNSELPITAKITVSKTLNMITSVLKLESIGYYEGYYYCAIENSAGVINSTLAYYEISVPCPEMILVPKPIKVRPDKTVTFSCVAWSYGGLVYKWSRNDSLSLPYNSTIFYEDKPLPVNSINTTMYEIKIFNIQETDEGQYCCVASNDCGSTTKCAWLEVNTSPIISLQPTSRTFKNNSSNVSVFEIVATGVGHVYYLWQKYNTITDEWAPLPSQAINDTSPYLNFSIITEEDQGIYHCIATNYDGSVISDNATITVFAAPTITYHSPAIVAFEGNKVNLICNATNDVDAIKPVQVDWYFRKMIVKSDEKHVVVNDVRNNSTGQIQSVLSFDPVNYTNDGVYTCQAFNDPLCFTESDIKLTVEYPPKVNLNPPGPTYTVSVGTRLFLYCVATGLPAPTIQWYQNGIIIPQQSSPLFLAFTNIPQVTRYTCEAKNNAGNMENTASASITVTVKRNGCPTLMDPKNGKVFQFSDGNAAIFSCDDGYTKSGSSFIHCLNGNWSSPAPTCVKSQ